MMSSNFCSFLFILRTLVIFNILQNTSVHNSHTILIDCWLVHWQKTFSRTVENLHKMRRISENEHKMHRNEKYALKSKNMQKLCDQKMSCNHIFPHTGTSVISHYIFPHTLLIHIRYICSMFSNLSDQIVSCSSVPHRTFHTIITFHNCWQLHVWHLCKNIIHSNTCLHFVVN